jgi:PhnB protein
MAKKATKAVPDGYHTITPHLTVRGAAKAMEFYKKAFGAEDLGRMEGPGGMIVHAEMQIGDSRFMLADEMPEMGSRSPQTLGGVAASLMIYTDNCDALFDRAVKAGATAKMPPADMFWGDRYGKLADPFGHEWAIGTHIEDLTPAEMEQRMKAEMARMAQSRPGGKP